MAFLDHIHACNRHDPTAYLPLIIAGAPVGMVGRPAAARLALDAEVFTVVHDTIVMNPALDTFDKRSLAVDALLPDLEKCGLINRIKGEMFRVGTEFHAPPLMQMDRGAIALFGVKAYGVHMNGYVRRPDGLYLWIARRALDKQAHPGKFDNMVAGGQPFGLGLKANLRKEAAEEAGIPADLADRALPVGMLAYTLDLEHGVRRDVLYCYDLELPADFVPHAADGEVEDFRLMPVAEVAEIVRTSDRFKFNCNLVIIDFLIRHGCLDPDREPDYEALAVGLRRLT